MTFLLGLPGVLLGLAKRLFGMIGKLQPFQLLSLALGLLSAFLWFHRSSDVRHWKKESSRFEALYLTDEQTIASIRIAQNKAIADNIAHVADDEAQRSKVTKESNDAYQARVGILRADFARGLRARTDSSRSGHDGLSALPVARPGLVGEAVQGDQPDLLYTAETELQLNALIEWIEQQSAINPNATPALHSPGTGNLGAPTPGAPLSSTEQR